MEGAPTDTTVTPEQKGDDKKAKKSEKTAGLGKSVFESAGKKDVAENIAHSQSLWEKFIPKEGGDTLKAEATPATPNSTTTERSKLNDSAQRSNEVADGEFAEGTPDAVVDKLTETEIAEVVKEYAPQRKAELEAGRSSEEDPADAVEREAAIDHLTFLEANPETAITEMPDDATETGAEAELEEADEALEPEAQNEVHDQNPAEFTDDEAIDLNAPEHPESPTPEDDVSQPSTPSAGGGTPPPATPNIPPAGGGGANQPPTTPNASYGAAMPGGGGPNTGGGSGGTANFNAMPVPAYNPNTVNVPGTTIEHHYHQENTGAYFLAGGILGYMLGRRRGRIKTEKRLKAVSNKLEKQITDVRQQVVRQEAVIRRQAREKYNETHTENRVSAPRTSQEIVKAAAQAHAAEAVVRSQVGRRPEAAAQLTKAEVSTNQRHAAERLGVTPAEAGATAARVQHLEHREVLAIAEKVVVDGTSLRMIYEAKQITEPGLRRITREFLRGGDVKAALQAEVRIKEMQYERDPQMRDRLAASYDDVDAASPQSTTEALAHLNTQNADEIAKLQTGLKEAQKDVKDSKQRGKQVIVSAWAVLIVVLVITAILLATR